MKKASRILALVLVLAVFASGEAFAQQKIKIAIVVKNLGNGFFEAVRDGGMETAKDLPGVDVERHALDGGHHTLVGGEGDAQVLDTQQRAHTGAASPRRIRGSRNAYRMSTTVLKKTMKNAPNMVTAISGGRSSLPIAWPA